VPSRLTEVAIDCRQPERLVAFWSAALGYRREAEGEGWIAIGPVDEFDEDDLRRAPQPPNLAFCAVPEPRVGKNRLHIDITPVGTTQAEEVARLTALGATLADVEQGDETWIVMADPEGNVFCVMAEV
jgi:catechol 2,3-dioxygenase-like lactoylglutathione lyase family enzyme